MVASIAGWFFGKGVETILGELRGAYEAKLRAENDEQKLAAEIDIARLESQVRTAELAAADRWSATSIGRYLVVFPFGLYLGLIALDSTFQFTWDVLKMPDREYGVFRHLFTIIVAGDVAKLVFRR